MNDKSVVILAVDAALWDRVKAYQDYCDEKLDEFYDEDGDVPAELLGQYDTTRFDLWEGASELLDEILGDAVEIDENGGSAFAPLDGGPS